MNHFKAYFLTTVGLIVFVCALSVLKPNSVWSKPGKQGPPKGLNVNVLNTVDTNTVVANDENNPVPVTVTGNPQIEPVLVSSSNFLDKTCAFRSSIYTVPVGKLLIIDDASATFVDSASASTLGDPGIVDNVVIGVSLDTKLLTTDLNTTSHIILGQRGLPARGGRRMRAYAGPNTEVFFSIRGCTVSVNGNVSFSGRLIDFQ